MRIREIFESQKTADEVVEQLTEYFAAEHHFPSLQELSSMTQDFLTHDVGLKAYHASFIKANIIHVPPTEFQGFPSLPYTIPNSGAMFNNLHSGRKLSPYTPHQGSGVGMDSDV